MRTYLADELDHVELISPYRGIVELAGSCRSRLSRRRAHLKSATALRMAASEVSMPKRRSSSSTTLSLSWAL